MERRLDEITRRWTCWRSFPPRHCSSVDRCEMMAAQRRMYPPFGSLPGEELARAEVAS